METFIHSFSDLFDQLGLDSSNEAIEAFIENHQIERGTPIEDASFWKPHQADFIRQAKANDADWTEIVDDLDTLLHKNSMED